MEKELIYKIAVAYYKDNKSQEEISRRFGISRIKVSRILKKARDLGVVQISIIPPPDSKTDMERILADAWNLDEVILAEVFSDDEKQLATIGYETWKYFKRIVKNGDTVGLSWGNALSAFTDSVEHADLSNLRIVQLVGGIGSPEADTHSSGLVLRIAEKLNGSGRILSAPGIVNSADVKQALGEDDEIRKTLEIGAEVDIAVVGIGIINNRFLPADDYGILENAGAVGDIAFQFFSDTGQDLTGLMSSCVIGPEWQQLMNTPRIIAAAGGVKKHRAISGALKTGLINVLVTDEDTGRYLYEKAIEEDLL